MDILVNGDIACLWQHLEWRIAIGDGAHVVKPSLGGALLAAPGSTEQTHHCVRLKHEWSAS